MFFKVSKLNLDGTLTTLDNLGMGELDCWMFGNYGKYATIQVESSKGQTIIYTDNGEEWVKCVN
jgi:hypothetical protein